MHVVSYFAIVAIFMLFYMYFELTRSPFSAKHLGTQQPGAVQLRSGADTRCFVIGSYTAKLRPMGCSWRGEEADRVGTSGLPDKPYVSPEYPLPDDPDWETSP